MNIPHLELLIAFWLGGSVAIAGMLFPNWNKRDRSSFQLADLPPRVAFLLMSAMSAVWPLMLLWILAGPKKEPDEDQDEEES